MAKTSRKTVGRARKAGPKRATKTRRAPATTRAATNDAERHVDGCDIDFAQGELICRRGLARGQRRRRSLPEDTPSRHPQAGVTPLEPETSRFNPMA